MIYYPVYLCNALSEHHWKFYWPLEQVDIESDGIYYANMSDSYNTSKKEFEKSYKPFMNERENSLSFFVTYPSDMFNILHPDKGIIHIPLSEFLKNVLPR